MAQANSTRARSRTEQDCPLWLHKGSQQWVKKVRGKFYYFGRDKHAAIDLWTKQEADIRAGRKPREHDPNAVTVRYACNYLLSAKKQQMEAGDLSVRQFDDLKRMAAYTADELGAERTVTDLGPDDFRELRTKMAKRWSTSGLVARVANIRSIFNFAHDEGLVKDRIKFGKNFSIPSKKQQRRARNEVGERMFEPDEIRRLLDAAGPHLRAFILLALNTGIGNLDVAMMEHRHIDLDRGWMNYPRRKTEIRRRAKLWDETCDAIKVARSKQPRSTKWRHLVFLTKYRHPWSDPDSADCAISKAFSKLTKQLDLHRRGRTFYALRHVFQTVADEARDPVATSYVMGHVDGSMASTYRERVSDARLEAVADTVHGWLFRSGGAPR